MRPCIDNVFFPIHSPSFLGSAFGGTFIPCTMHCVTWWEMARLKEGDCTDEGMISPSLFLSLVLSEKSIRLIHRDIFPSVERATTVDSNLSCTPQGVNSILPPSISTSQNRRARGTAAPTAQTIRHKRHTNDRGTRRHSHGLQIARLDQFTDSHIEKIYSK